MTSRENTICTKSATKDDCPITWVDFIEKEDYPSSKYAQDNSTYTARKWDDFYFVFSKVKGDNLPLLSTALEFSEPCMVPGQTTKPQ